MANKIWKERQQVPAEHKALLRTEAASVPPRFSLERMIGTEKLESLKRGPTYGYWVDTVSLSALAVPMCMSTELFIMHLTLAQSLKARAIGGVVGFFISRPYGKYRDYVFEKSNTTEESSFVKKTATDMFAFTSFQAPIYAAMLACSGASGRQIMVGMGIMAVTSSYAGRLCGAYLDASRKFCGLHSALESAKRTAD